MTDEKEKQKFSWASIPDLWKAITGGIAAIMVIYNFTTNIITQARTDQKTIDCVPVVVHTLDSAVVLIGKQQTKIDSLTTACKRHNGWLYKLYGRVDSLSIKNQRYTFKSMFAK